MKAQIFQKYHSKENVVTANLMFFLERVKYMSSSTYYGIIEEWFDGQEDLTERIKVQEGENKKNGGSIPDAIIKQESYKIVIETKLNSKFNDKQLKGHLESFGNEDHKLLLTVDPKHISEKNKSKIEKLIEEYEKNSSSGVTYKHVTFRDIVERLDEMVPQYQFELKDLIEDYRRYCIEDKLIGNTETLMRAVPAGGTFNFSFENGVYYKKYTGYREVSYVGLYKEKSIRAIGKVKVIIEAEIDKEKKIVTTRRYSPTKGELDKDILKDEKEKIYDEKEKIYRSIEDAEKRGWDLSQKHVYYMVEEFVQCDFKKESKGGMQGFRYMDLQDIKGIKEKKEDSLESIIEILNMSSWE